MGKFRMTGQSVVAMSREGFGVTLDVEQDEAKLKALALEAGKSERGMKTRGPLRVRLSSASRAYLAKMRAEPMPTVAPSTVAPAARGE